MAFCNMPWGWLCRGETTLQWLACSGPSWKVEPACPLCPQPSPTPSSDDRQVRTELKYVRIWKWTWRRIKDGLNVSCSAFVFICLKGYFPGGWPILSVTVNLLHRRSCFANLACPKVKIPSKAAFPYVICLIFRQFNKYLWAWITFRHVHKPENPESNLSCHHELKCLSCLFQRKWCPPCRYFQVRVTCFV